MVTEVNLQGHDYKISKEIWAETTETNNRLSQLLKQEQPLIFESSQKIQIQSLVDPIESN